MTVTAVTVFDATLRDGSHAIRHQFTVAQVREIAAGLDAAGVRSVGVGHGEGLGGSSLQLGEALHTDEELLVAVAGVLRRARLAVTLVPGIGTKEHLRRAAALGARLVRIATHCTEADIAVQHIALARELGLDVHGDLMMPHRADPATLSEQAAIMAGAGAQGVHLMDSAGALLPDDVRVRIAAMRERLGPAVALGMHAHDNLSLAVANTLAAIAEGATLADACLGGLGAGAGNTRTEVLAAVLDRMGIATGLDVFALQDLADDVVRPIAVPSLDRQTATLGYAGVPSSLLLPARRAAERFGVEPRAVLAELGRRGAVTGQEDLALGVAADLAGAGERRVTADATQVQTGQIYARLREEILAGAFQPDKPISQIKLAERLGVSRTPLREALRMLQRDGLIHSEPNRRVRVTALSIGDLEELYASRIVLEALALRITMQRAGSAELEQLDEALEAMSAAATNRDLERWERPHRRFHEILRGHAGTRIAELGADLAAHGERYRRVYLNEPIAWSSADAEHRAIVEAWRAGDDRLATEHLARHLARTALTVIASVAPEHDALPVRTAVRLVAGLDDPKEGAR